MNNENYLICGDFLVPHPMKYCGAANQKVIDEALSSGSYVCQKKYDGAFYQLVVNDSGSIGLFSRTISKKNGEYVNRIDNVPHIKEWARNNLPNDTVLIGEIYIPGGKSNAVTSIMGCLPEKAIERQEKNGYVQYLVFDAIKYNGIEHIEKGFLDRYSDIVANLNCNWAEQDDNSGVHKIESFAVTDSLANLDKKLRCCDNLSYIVNEVFSNDGEGVVFKHVDSVYRPDKRTVASQAFKLKEHVDSIDLVVMDLLDPVEEYTGKELDTWQYWKDGKPVTKAAYYGWKNAIRLGAYTDDGTLIEVGRVASGLTDELREDMSVNPSNYLYNCVEVECMSIDKKEKTLRHPVFKRFRSDKNAAECLISEIF